MICTNKQPPPRARGSTSGVGRHVVRVIKRMGQLEYWAVFEVRSGRQMLALQSMWNRGRPPTLRP